MVATLLLSPLIWAQQGPRPNVIFIYSDDQGYADLGIYGSDDLHTPHLDSLAQAGMRFTQAYVAAPVCSPSRAALLSGRYPQRAQQVGNAPMERGRGGGFPTEQYTIAELFKDGGYTTAHIGKWHLGMIPEERPNGQGFDYSFGFMGGLIDLYSHYWSNNHDLWENNQEIFRPGEYFPDLMLEYTQKFLDQPREDPFFMYWAINIPHYPYQGEVEWLEYYKDLPFPRNNYAAFVSTMDEKVGDLMQLLKERGLDENTIIIFQADHGFSREGIASGGGGSAGIYRGSKFSLFEGGIRVPTFITWKDHIEANRVEDAFVTNIDWFPTLADISDLPMPDRKIDGKSMWPLIRQKSKKGTHDTFFWQSLGTQENPQWAVRDGDWKLLHRPYESDENELTQEGFFLVNLADDPSETTNVADKHPRVVKRLHKKYQQWISTVEEQ